MSERSDEELIRQVLAGARARFSLLIQRHQDRLYRYAVGMLAEPLVARGLVEKAFMDAYANLRECRPRERFGLWALGILRTGCMDRLAGLRTDHSDADPPRATSAPRPTTLQEAIQVLPDPELREAFLLKHVEGMAYEELEALVGVSRDELQRRVRRAREALWAGMDAGALFDRGTW